MARRRQPVPVTTPGRQRPLDEEPGRDHEERAERDHHDLRRPSAKPVTLPYEERVAAWIREREEVIRRKTPPPPG